MTLAELLRRRRHIRVLGFDDGPGDTSVPVAGVVCNDATMEGLVWSSLTRDGVDATEVLSRSVRDSKYAEQVHIVLTDGLTMGGLNVVDLAQLHAELGVPVVAVMRRLPDLPAFHAALDHLSDGAARRDVVQRAGSLHGWAGGAFQVVGDEPEVIAAVLERLTTTGRVPECLRLAHLITGAVATGASGRRA